MCFTRRENPLVAGMSVFFCLVLLVCLAACASPGVCAEGEGSAEKTRAAISPHLARVATDSEVQFAVKVAGKPAEAVTWLVNGVPGGNESVGTIAGGLYHSPASVPVPNEMHIEARLADGDVRLMSTVLIGRCGPGYKLVRRWKRPDVAEGQPYELHGICVDRSGNVIVTDVKLNRVDRFSPKGKSLGEIGFGRGTGAGFFDGPRDAKVDAKGRVYVIDGTSNTLQRFDPDGNIVFRKVEPDGGKANLNRPHGIDLDRSGRMYIADVDNKRIAVYDEECRFLMDWPSPPVGPEDTIAPHGIGVDPNGDVFVADYNGKCHKFTGSGELLFTFPDTKWNYHAMCTDRWGDVYFAARNKAMTRLYIQKYNNHGIHIVTWEIPREGVYGKPDCVAVDAAGNVFATDDLGVDVFAPTSEQEMDEWLSQAPPPPSGKEAVSP